MPPPDLQNLEDGRSRRSGPALLTTSRLSRRANGPDRFSRPNESHDPDHKKGQQ
jgi:hypothetical protein